MGNLQISIFLKLLLNLRVLSKPDKKKKKHKNRTKCLTCFRFTVYSKSAKSVEGRSIPLLVCEGSREINAGKATLQK